MFGGEREVGAEAVLVAADQAMYRAKEEGRNRIALFQDPTRAAARAAAPPDDRRRGSATRSPTTASASHTQPIRSLASGGIERYELLLRMTGDDGELLPAASFIEAAERSGMVQELDRWVVARALELLGRARARRASRSPSTSTSPAPRSTDISVLEFIERRLDEGDADPGALHLRDHRDRRRSTTTTRPPASPTASPSSAARSRSTTTAPASAPSTT